MTYITDIDFRSNIVFTDNGEIFEIETYLDEFDDPCLIEDAVSLYYFSDNGVLERHVLTEEQLEIIEYAFD